MAIAEILQRILDKSHLKNNDAEDYVHKLRPLSNVSDEDSIWDHVHDEQFESFGLTQEQKTRLAQALWDMGHIVRYDQQKEHVESYFLKIGDVRRFSDEQLLKITSKKDVQILRALFGNSEENNPG
jgi:hypothetical protein